MQFSEMAIEEAEAKKKMLECQWGKHNEKLGIEWIEKTPECQKCKNRFQCLTMSAKRFKLTVTQTIWTTYEVFAENEDEVMELFASFGTDEPLMRELKSDGDGGDVEIEEWSDSV